MKLATDVVLRALVVELIRRLWNRGLLRKDHKIAKLIHDNWFEFWVEYKTAQTMADVDRQIEAMFYEEEEDPWLITEELEGETPLGGEMRARHRAFRDD